MKSSLSMRTGRRLCCGLLLVISLLFLAGCGLEQHFFWSPDGKQGAVLSKEGVFLCSLEGKLTPLFPEGRRVAWLPDSVHMVVCLERKTDNWAVLSSFLKPEETAAIERDAAALAKKLDAGAGWDETAKEVEKVEGEGKELLRFCLHALHAASLRAHLKENEQKELSRADASFYELVVARIEAGTAVVERSLGKTATEIFDIRSSPDGQAVVIASSSKRPGEMGRLQVALLKQSGLVDVTTGASLFPDWTPDSRSLVYDQGMVGGVSDSDQASLGLIVMRTVRNAEGAIAISEKTKELAGVLHDGKTRVRCLKDGRILFNGYDLKLPLSGADLKELKQQLFMLDPQRHASLVHVVPLPSQDILSEEIVFFEVSPDESQVLFLSKERYTVDVLTIATGEIEEVIARDENKSAGIPSWLATGEVVYFKGYPSVAGKKPERSFEIAVRKGKEDRILSTGWSNEFLKGLGKDDRK